MSDVKEIVDHAFCVALFKLQEAFEEGYRLTENVPIFIAGLYRIEMVKKEYVEEFSEAEGEHNPLAEALAVAEVAPPDVAKAVAKRGPKPKAK